MREEQMPNIAGEVSIYREIEPLKNVANQTGERRAKRRRQRGGRCIGPGCLTDALGHVIRNA